MEVCGTKRKCLLDSGSDVTLIPSSFIPGCKVFRTTERVLAANGTPIRIAGEVNIEVAVKGHLVRISGLSTDHIWEPGRPCLAMTSCVTMTPSGSLEAVRSSWMESCSHSVGRQGKNGVDVLFCSKMSLFRRNLRLSCRPE